MILFLFLFSMAWLMLFVYSACCLYMWVWDVQSSPLHAKILLVIGQSGFGQVWAFWVEKRELPSVKKKNLVRREAFSGYDGCRPKFGWMAISLFVHCWCSVVVGQSSAEWPFLYLFIVDVQWLSGSHDRMAIFSCVQCWCRVSLFCCYFVGNLSYINMYIFCIMFIYV